MDPDTAVSQKYIRTIVVNGDIPSLRSGNRYLIDFDELLRYLSGNIHVRNTKVVGGSYALC